MTHFETGYQPLHSYHDNGEETPQDGGVMIHVVPESSKGKLVFLKILRMCVQRLKFLTVLH